MELLKEGTSEGRCEAVVLQNKNFDKELLETKLVGWEECKVADLEVGNHIRVTKNKYKQPGRTCSYCVVQRCEGDKTLVNSFGEKKYADWLLDPDNPFKQIKIYRRPETSKQEHTGFCIRGCGSVVKEPYYLCYYCRSNR